MGSKRIHDLSAGVIACAAQLVYIGHHDEAYRLLSETDRLLRYFGSLSRKVPVAFQEELRALEYCSTVFGILRKVEIRLSIDADSEQIAETFLPAGLLVDEAFDRLFSLESGQILCLNVGIAAENGEAQIRFRLETPHQTNREPPS